MMRGMTGTILCACMAGGVGIGLFFVKHEVKEAEARLSSLNQEIGRNVEEIHVLKAEWSYLNDPARLRQLSEKHLGMKPMGPTQMASLEGTPRNAPIMAGVLPPAAGKASAAAHAPAHAPATVAKAAPAPQSQQPAKPAVVARAAEPAPAPVAAAPATAAPAAQPAPKRSIVIQSPALAAGDGYGREAR